MGDVVGVFLRQLGHELELFRSYATVGNLDALHARSIPGSVRSLGVSLFVFQLTGLLAVVALTVVVTLAVDCPT